jgi:ornithine cyclodeaminase/alanine dehydrogenase-like protein (mu-crystallin family)
MTLTVLTAADIRRALPIGAAIESQRRAYRAVASREAVMPLRTPIAIPEREAVTLFMPARVGNDLGAKIVSVFPKNPASNLPMINGLVVMLDSATGRPAAILDAAYLTALRTAAGTGTATDVLARPAARIVGILGSGALARAHLLAMCEIRPINEVRIYSRDPKHVAAFIDEMQPQVGAALVAAPSPAAAVNEADVICCVTTSATPVCFGRDLRPGAHVNGVGSYTPQMQEVDAHTVKLAGKVFVDSRESVLAEAGDVIYPINLGLITENDLVEIGAVIAGRQPGRESADGITFFKSCGMAAQDVAAAGEVLRRAKELKLGVEISL